MKKLILIFTLFSMFSISLAEEVNVRKVADFKLKLLNGKRTSFYTILEEGPVLLDFWATWCGPCKKAMVHQEYFHQKYKDQGFQILTINQDSPKSLSKVKGYIRSKKFSFLVGLDPNQQIAKMFNAVLLPTMILIDKEGEIVWRHQGFIPGDEVEIEAKIKSLLAIE
ncbi:MAG: TlpA family protein disulfide reductase [Candidatus Marinimicrobia bacterium]|jgi:cytochrome c biogenesis protein CcmG/thiol:disulfide interchange protein DsbE|nr:TlpA family protein disulfide reductase [Candidatus Neomarinimicrobiota bacterium]MBT3497229.1 TlpA family protein disulfide reductase [Candidatus Neomarinimicrobiota bacterium]MBT3692813.1 TlpA family protein disulfide reductase [Candidatus Neomarinimicrobiota bacterium]MBT3732999.1 TlpA family protein disulfide reductase [Candidatus Neomarinimicrobiota bacterium]MBT4144093.1 TlpA family protein disulfide reductase [Candidatus Neomarinimicrobiota bacterium]